MGVDDEGGTEGGWGKVAREEGRWLVGRVRGGGGQVELWCWRD